MGRGGKGERSSVKILGVRVDCVDFAQTLAQIDAWIDQSPSHLVTLSPLHPVTPSTCHQICTVNPEFIIDAGHHPSFAAVLRRADLCVPDGVGVVWAARRQGVYLHERVTGSDGIYRICERAAEQGWRVFFLGAAADVGQSAADRLCQHYPGLQVAGTYSGTPSDDDWPMIQSRLIKSQPNILFVAFGHPKQDFWIDRHRQTLPVDVAIGVGGAFDFVAGVQKRAPVWMQQIALEWLYRLLREPWRVKRMWKLPLFVVKIWMGR